MKNIVNRALVAKKKQFLSKSVPRGTRTIWRYLGALFLLFAFGIGQMWGASPVTYARSECTISGSNIMITDATKRDANISSVTITNLSSNNTYFKVTGKTNSNSVITVTPAANVTLTSVVLVFTTAPDLTKVNLYDGNTTSSTALAASESNTKFTWSGSSTSAKSFGYLNASGTSNNYGQLGSIIIGYTTSGGDPVDPEFTYTPATYTIGDPALDLSTKLTSTNTTGAITFAIKDAASTGATIANSKNFTATTVGTAKVTVTQAASTGYNAKSQDIDVTVAAPDPCHKYFWFSKAADATTAGVTNNEGSFFTTSASGSNSTTSSLTIDEVEYAITNRTGNIGADDATIVSFTIPANKAGVLYVNMASSGNKGESSSRTLYLKKGGDTIVTATNAIYGDGAQHNATIENIPSGTYTLHANNNVKVGMFAVKACDATYHTITLDLDGGTGATSIAALDGVPAYKPADPTKAHCAFAGWVVKSTSAAYDWDANVTGDLELKATWTQLYTVTFANGGGSGDAPAAVADKAQGETFTVPANTFTAPTNKEFDIWNDGSADYAPGVTYTVGTANVVLTAQWKTLQDKYTVIFKDGDVTLGTRQFDVASNPSDADIDKTKSLFTFAAWQKDAADIALDAAFWATVAKDAEITLTARWAKAYATSYDMEAYAASEGASKAGIEAALTAANYAYTNINDIDNGHTHNYTYDGLKYKTNDGDLSFNVVAGKVVEVKTGHLPSNDAITMYINGVADATVFEGADEEQETHKMNYFYSAAEALYRLDVKASKGTCSVKKITIRDPYQVSYDPHGADAIAAQYGTPSVTLPTPVNGTGNFKGWYDAETEGNKIGNAGASYTPTANITLHAQWETVSSDNTLSDLQVDGATVAGFDPAVQIYNLVYEYGQQPVITSATATAGALATVTINNTPVEEATFKYVQVKVEAESGAERFYQVRYTNNPKQGATIFKAELTSNTAADYSGMYADGDNSEIKLADDGANGYKFSGTSNYVKMAIADATFAEGDMLKMTYTTNPQQGELAIYDGTTKLQGTAYSNHILTFSDVADGKSTVFIRRTDDNNFNGWVAQVEVQRYMAPIIKSYKIGAVSGTIDQDLKTIAIELPFGTTLSGVAATIEAYANGGATVIAPTPLAYDTPLGYKVSSAYAEDGDVDYTVTITEAEASHEATLSDIKLDGVSLEGFDPATLSYNVELEKGTLAYPTVTYTAATGATVVPNSETFPGAYNLVVTAEDGSTTQTYTINFTVSTKDKVVIFDGSTMDAIATSPDVTTGLSWLKTGDMSVESKTAPAAAAKAYTKAIQIGSTGSSKNFKVVVPNKYAAQFFLAHNSNGDAERTVYIDTEYGQAPKDGIYNVANTKSDIAEGKSSTVGAGTYYINVSGGTVNIYEISVYLDRVSETPAISAQPTNLAVCAISTDALSVTASVEAGTLSYQWYKVVGEGDDEAVGTNSNEYVPAAVGQYYVVVTNTEGTYTPSSKKSDVVTVSLKPATEITSAPSNQRGAVDAVVTLSVEAVAATNYAWYTCDENGDNAVAVEGASGATKTSIQVTIIEDMRQYYKVVVTGECGTDEAIALVEEWSEVAQANVTGYQKWDWNVTTNAAAWAGVANIQLTGADKTTDFIMANTASTMPNNAAFRSDMLITNGEYPARPTQDGGVFQGYAVKFHTTVPGKVTVVYRGTGGSVKVNLKINDWTPGETSDWKTKNVVVPAGDVVITDINDEVLRIRSIEFDPALNPEDAEASTLGGYTRSVTEGRYGTICLPNGGIMVGAELFEIAYYGQTSHKIFLDNIPSGEMVAGRPYIFLPKEGTTQLAVFYTDEANASAGSHNGLIGFIGAAADEYFDIPDGEGNYILQNNLYREVLTGGQARILSNRAYIKLSAINPTEPALAPGRRRVAMGVQSEQVATGCENLNVSDKPVKMIIDGQLFILRGEKMYDAKGQLVK